MKKQMGNIIFFFAYTTVFILVEALCIYLKSILRFGLFEYYVSFWVNHDMTFLDTIRHIYIDKSTFAYCLFGGVLLMVFTIASLEKRVNKRPKVEHGSAKFGKVSKISKNIEQNGLGKILTKNVSIGLNTKKHKRNLNTLVVGGSGAGKTRTYALPNILQANTSFVVLDPKGEILRETGNFLEKEGYKIKILNLIDMDKSHSYNPIKYLKSENDVQRLVTNLFKSTDKGAKSSDPFWDATGQMLLMALIFYLIETAPREEQNFPMIMELLRTADNEKEGDLSILDNLFMDLELQNPDSLAVKYYRSYRTGADKTLKSIQITLVSKLEKFNLSSIESITTVDELELDNMGLEKTALFAIIPDNDDSFNFLISILYTQLFQQLFYVADNICHGELKVPVHFLMDEYANIQTPNEFDKILSTMRSRGVFVSIIIQNMAQLKKIHEKEWESIVGNCDEFLYLGGNEQSTHKYISELMGKETIVIDNHDISSGKNGNMNTHFNKAGRELLTSDEVRMLDNRYALLFVRGEYPIKDLKFNLKEHKNISLTPTGGGKEYAQGKLESKNIEIELMTMNEARNMEIIDITEYYKGYEALSEYEFERFCDKQKRT
ncbi:MAG: type IV secretory system conjugative DNA transfer family protein [Clostridia bacterium]|nr:type IV secretory system conjugative DNA transfer family protein [Clostridia bacterium]